MSDTVLVALIGLAGSGAGAFGGILVSSKLTQYRLEQHPLYRVHPPVRR